MKDTVIPNLKQSMDVAALREFGEIEQMILRHWMEKCGLEELPPPVGDLHGERCSGDMVCETCGELYYAHPMDWRVIGYGHVPFLNVLCDGRRVKL